MESRKIYGYARTSTPQQNIERQVRNIQKEYPGALMVTETYTGTKEDRPKWDKLKKSLVSGDTVVFDSVSRMSRDAESGFLTYQELYEKGVRLVFLKEPMINTEIYRAALEQSVPLTGTAVDAILEGVNRYLYIVAKEQIRLAFEQAEKEVQDLHQRTSEGMLTAKLNGKQIGQKQGAKLTTKKSVEAKRIILQHSKAFGGTLDDRECMALAGCSRNSFYKYKQELRGTAGYGIQNT
jgi:DNA invertase Pin-like site-specific DNA recombinase